MTNDIVIGAGISGLSFGYFSKKMCLIFEKETSAGGLCRSVTDSGFTFDYSGHFIHIKDKKIKTLLEKLLEEKLLTVKRNSSIYFKGLDIPFPFQANLYYLGEKEKKECIDGVKHRKKTKIYNDMPFIDWCNAMFGSAITKYFMRPYNEKLWNYDLKKLTSEWTAPFVPKPSSKSIIQTAYKKNDVNYGYNSVFYYPRNGGCGAVVESMYKKLKNTVITGVKVESVDFKNKTVLAAGKKYSYKNLISTQPLPELLKQIKNVPSEILKSAQNLCATSVRCINIGLKYKKEIPALIKNKHWIYLPEKKFPFYRAGIYSNANPNSAPENSYCIYVEFSSCNGRFEDTQDTVKYLKQAGIIGIKDEITAVNVIDIPYAYVIFDKKRKKTLEMINKFLNDNDIYLLGRYGAWEYSFMEKNITDAKSLALKLNKQNEKN